MLRNVRSTAQENTMTTDLVKHLSVFLREYLPRDCGFSTHTVSNYALSFKLLVGFVSERFSIRPCQLEIDHLSVERILDFLEHLEKDLGNSTRTRNNRLAAIKSFFRYLEFARADYLDQARQVHAIPLKRFKEPLVDTLNQVEVKALLDAPPPDTFSGIRDRAMLHLAYSAALRVSELVGLMMDDLRMPSLDHIHVLGKGRRERVLPLWKETKVLLREWLSVRPQTACPNLFVNARSEAMTRQGFNHRMAVHLKSAAKQQPSLLSKKLVSPHTLRHSCALNILESTGDIRKVSLWLGHSSIQSSEIYLRVDPCEKLDIQAAGFPSGISKGTFNDAEDRLIAMLTDVSRQ